MSTTIDERVVQMRFDNKHFESNVSTSMSTLDKLKQKLNLSGASKGLEEIHNTSKKCNFSTMGSAIDTVSVKFSALQIMGVTALTNITNSAIDAGKRIGHALAIDPIKTGFSEYETQINAVQTILANTSPKGTTIDQVKDALNELNTYADQTIYNFTEMTRNIGTFTAAGIDLETSVGAIQGIANLAAVSGSTSQQASTAMYQLSQALASGTVKLMDWNSVVNAGMGGEVFQNALKETSRLLGTGADSAIEATGSFRESLREGWLTAEVLTETLKKFTTSGANEYVAKYIGESPEVVEAAIENAKAQYGEAEAIEKASEALANKSGKNKEEIKSVLEMAQNATDAATKVKTFSQLWQVMKESAQSGWAKTWQIIIGDFEEAKNLLSPLSEFFTNVINKISDARNDLLNSALGKGFTSLAEKITGVLKPAAKAADTVKNVTGAITDLGDIVDRVILGEFGNGHDRFVALTEAGINYYKVQNKVNETLNNGFRYTDKQIEAQDELLGKQKATVETTKESTESTESAEEATIELTDAQKDQIKELAKLSDAELKAKGYTDDQIEAFRELRKEAEKLGIPLDDFIDNLDQINGRWLLINSFKNIGKGLIEVFKSIGKAWSDTFDGIQADDLYNIIAAFHKFTTKLIPNKEAADNLTRTFKGLFAVIDIVTTILGGAFKIAFKVVKAVLEAFDVSILDVTANIGDALVAFRDWLFETNPLAKAIDKLIIKLPELIKKIKYWFAAFKETPAVQKFIDAIKGIGEAFRQVFNGEIDIGTFAAKLGKGLGKLIVSLPGLAVQIGKDFIAGFIEGIGGSIGNVITKIIGFCKNFVASFAAELGVQSPSWKAFEIAGDFFQGFINGAKAVIGKVIDILKQIGQGIVSVFQGFWDYLTDESGKVDWNKIIIGGAIIVAMLFVKKFLDIFDKFAGVASGFKGLISATTDTMKGFADTIKAMKWEIRANALKSLAIAIGILVASIWVLTTIDDYGKLWNAVLVIGALAGILIGLGFAMNKMNDATVSIGKEGLNINGIKNTLLQVGVAILLLSLSIKMMAGLDEKQAEQGFKAVGIIMLGMGAFVAGIAGISRYAGDMGSIGKTMTKLAVAMLLMVYVCKLAANLTPEQMIKGSLFAGAFVGFVAALTGVTKLVGKDIDKVGGMVFKVTLAMLLMVAVCKLAGKLTVEEMHKSALFAAGFVVLVGALVSVTKVGKEQKLAQVNGLIFMVSVSMLLLAGVCKIAGKLSKDDMIKGAALAAGFTILLAALVKILTITNEQQIANVTGTIIATSFALAVLAGICILLSSLEPDAFVKGLIVVGALSGMLTAMIHGLRGAADVGKTMMWMTVAIAVMAAAVVVLSNIDTDKLAASAIAMSAMMGMFALMMAKMRGLHVDPKPVLGLVVVIAAMAAVLWGLDALNVENAIPNAIALSILLGAMVGALQILNLNKVDPKTALKSALALSTLVIPLLLLIGVLTLMKGVDASTKTVVQLTALMGAMAGLLYFLNLKTFNPKKTLKNVMSLTLLAMPLLMFTGVLALMKGADASTKTVVQLTALMGAMAGLLYFLNFKKFNLKKIFKNVLALTTLAIPLVAFCAVLKGAQYVDASTKTVIQLIALISACTALLYPLTYLAKIGLMNAIKGVLALTAMAVPMLAFVGVLALMNKVENATENVKALTVLMGALTLMLIPLTVIGGFIIPALLGLASLTLMAVPMLAFIGVLALMNKVENATENINALLKMMTTMTVLLTQLALIGPMAIVGVTAMTMLATLMTVMGVVATTIGALMTKFPSIEKFLDTGLPVLERLGGSIGAMIGNFISGIAGGFTGVLVKMGSDLELFTASLSVASANASTIKAGSFDGIKDLVLVLLEIAGASVGTSIADMFTSLFSDQTSMEKFIEDATALFEGMTEIGEACSGTEIDQDAFDAVVKAAQALADLQKSLEPIGGVISWLTGRDDLATFGENASQFFDAMKVGLATLNGMTVDEDALDAVIKASERLSTLQQSLESIGGVVDWFTGRDDLATFGENVAEFFGSMKVAMATLEGMAVDTTALDAVIKASERLSTLQQSLESIGGVVDWFTGRDDLATFGENVAEFFGSMKTGLATLEGTTVDETALESVIKASERLSTLQGSLNNIGGVLSWFKGRDDLGTFGESVKPFAIGMQELSKCGVIDPAAVESMVAAGGTLSAFQETLPAVGKITEFFSGRSDLGSFGTGVGSFATGMQALSQCGTIDLTILTNLTEAAGQLATLEVNLPSVGEITEFFAGRSDLGTFGTNIGSFATGMQALSQCGTIDQAAFESIMTAAGSLTGLQQSIEPIGGMVTWFKGNSDLGTFGETIKTFMINMKEALDAINGLTYDEAAFNNVKFAAGSLTGLQQSIEPIGGMVTWFKGDSDLGAFGETIKTFMTNMRDALVAIDGMPYDEAAFNNVKFAAGSLTGLQQSIEPIGGMVTWFKGNSDLATFGETIKTFMTNMRDALVAINGMPYDEAAFTNIKNAATDLDGLQEDLEPIGGVVTWFTGRSDLGTFGEAIGKFADGMKALAECKGFDATTILSITGAAQSLNTLQGQLDNSVGGVISWFTGRTDLGTFGVSIGQFASGMQALFNCTGFKEEQVGQLISAAERLKDLENGLTQNVGGVVSWFTGRTDLGTFGTSVGQFATGMQSLAECKALDTEVITTLTDAATQLSKFESELKINIGGIVSWFTDKDDLGTFGTNVGLFANGMQALAGCTALDAETITSLTDAASEVAKFTASLSENFGGLFTWFKDKTEDMEIFSTNVTLFATGMKDFGTASASVDPTCTENFIAAAKKMKEFIAGLVDFDGSGFDTFKTYISEFASKMTSFSVAALGVDPMATTNILSAATRLKAFIKALADFDGSGFDSFKGYISTFASKMGQFSLAAAAIDPAATTNIISAATRLKAFIRGLVDFDGTGFDIFKNYITTFAVKMADFSARSINIDFTAVKNATNAGNSLKNFINSLASIDASGVDSFKSAVDTLSTVNVAGMLDAFADASGKFSAAGATMISDLISGIESKTPSIKTAATTMISVMTAEIQNKHSMFKAAGATIGNNLIQGFSSKENALKSKVSTMLSSMVTAVRDKYNSFYLAGAHLVDGMAKGISQNSYKAAAKAKAMAEAAVEAAREELDINSPSKVFKAIGSGIPEGFAMGIGMLGGSVKDSVTGMASTAIKSARSAMTTVLEALNGEMDAQPTIRPVIDLTDVRSGANAINGMFAGAHTVGVQSNLNAINFAMNRKLQNGINDDVVSAIKDLNSSLDNARGDTYNLGGVTYSNGDEVADAVQTIVRAALIGRRV